MLEGKKIILGISGSIAAYKSAALARLFVKAGAEVKVIMTSSSQDFITPITMATLSRNPVLIDFVKGNSGEWNNHVELGLLADIMIIAPASANTLAKMAHGICDNLLLATYLSARCPVFVAPAMDLDMFAHPATQNNLKLLSSFGNTIFEPNAGELASGLEGKGRMVEPEEILEFISNHFSDQQILKGKKVLITAGPTYEHIDPVRFVGNHSTGKMGFAIAEVFASKGAQVILVTGPSNQKAKHGNITRIDVTSAAEMYDATLKHFPKTNIAVMSAAVADYTPEKVSISKIKKSGDELQLKLKKTRDILKELGKIKTKKQILVGFALETDNEEANAIKKLNEKNLDFIVLNSLKNKGAGFGFDTNQIQVIHKGGEKVNYGLKPKHEVAKDIVDQIIKTLHA
ncbi:MAG: bifunctional phosphopantothenoylcysteine decarboxylase/phosphopantothenate--cysteine ligase CoaBC [Bacteroidia bacterium]|nr:bifunctional phosphopantothenoylcysteine decarboxylase/phosphopantothenate--cysteine ligase CoaBC [Bacteroidia bacterium]MCF8425588.1 bifunctional phosphopantothenoylcysteine decarboxylase/phosphopantothenate--cysteine ligase CoaBC [Bacteroidia bacterium]MCF8445709.1 bifunctional phosphopantothenoylcysteine decarboxylase/phosphopantothenate--cysteine ligase CoaBC [Bacteroidia bacterium]